MTRIIICCYGITRSLRHTVKSIRRNVIDPARARGTVSVYCHFFDQGQAIAVSGKREGAVDVGEAQLLEPDWIETEAPGACLETWSFDEICGFGDFWGNNFISARNLIHQLHSINRVSSRALEDSPDIVIFCRPDLRYHDSMADALNQAVACVGRESRVFLPFWQSWGGYNDRFAIAVGTEAIRAYGSRIARALPYCQQAQGALQSERLVKYALTEAGIPVTQIPVRASRVRASGFKVWESFGDEAANFRHEKRKNQLWALLDASGLKPLARRVAHLIRPPR